MLRLLRVMAIQIYVIFSYYFVNKNKVDIWQKCKVSLFFIEVTADV